MTETAEFTGFVKIPRLFRATTITEKIDGTNAAVVISAPVPFGTHAPPEAIDRLKKSFGFLAFSGLADDYLPDTEHVVRAQSRSQFLTPEKSKDNFGFAAWVWANADGLVRELGPGLHFGEFWGQGIQRNYGLDEKRFSLFNTKRWGHLDGTQVSGLYVVPVLAELEVFDTTEVEAALSLLALKGSSAAPGFMNPEGVVVYHHAANQLFKYTLGSDGHKGVKGG